MGREYVEIWNNSLDLLKREMTSTTFSIWVDPLIPCGWDGDFFVLAAPDDTVTTAILNGRHLKTIEWALTESVGHDTKAKIMLADQKAQIAEEVREDGAKETDGATDQGRYVFDTFVKGKSNELAFAASVAVAESPGNTTYNPLFLYGGVGLGKTHLMCAIANFVRRQNPEKRVIYMPTENLMNEFVASIRERKNPEFRDKYRNVDVLLVDDIQFMSDKEGIQEEFFHTFNALYSTSRQIVISSDKPPTELKMLEERLSSRLSSGLSIDITPPDLETRMAIIEKKAQFMHVKMPTEVTHFIAKSVSSNIRELEGAFINVVATAKLSNASITLELADGAIKKMFDTEKRALTSSLIQELVAEYFHLTIDDLTGKKRQQNITYARHIAMYLCRKLLKDLQSSLTTLGNDFGGRDHTTVLHACNKIVEEIENNKECKKDTLEIERRIQETC
jgi:chromosomal replication initiator protein